MTTTDGPRPPLGIRIMHALGKEPEWSTLSAADLEAFAIAQNRKRSSSLARLITGRPDPSATIEWRQLGLADRHLGVRVYRPGPYRAIHAQRLPLIVHVHGGGFVGTATQSDWLNSHLAARLPALVVSVEHRLLAPGTPLTAIVDDTWDVVEHLLDHASDWHLDPRRTAVIGESTGGAAAALTAIRARDRGVPLRAQVLVNPCVDLTDTMFDGSSVTTYADSPTLTRAQMEFFAQLAVPAGSDPRAVSPLVAEDLSRLAPALVVVPTYDPLSDQGRSYAARLHAAGTSVTMSEYPGATHAFVSMPGVVPQAKAARAEIARFLRQRLRARR